MCLIITLKTLNPSLQCTFVFHHQSSFFFPTSVPIHPTSINLPPPNPSPVIPSPYLSHLAPHPTSTLGTSLLSSTSVSSPLLSQSVWCSNICELHSNLTDISLSQSVQSSPQACSFLSLSTPLPNPLNLVHPPAHSLLHHTSTKSHP